MVRDSGERRVWITGAAGLIGRVLVEQGLGRPGWKPVGLTRETLDLLDAAAVGARFEADAPAAVIHCAAMSRNPACAADPDRAWRTNVEVTRQLAVLAARASAPLVLLSTDLVFDGLKGAYREEDPLGPRTVYARTKAAAEGIVREGPANLVIRTSLNHGTSPTRDRGFNEEIERAWDRGETLRLFVDEYRQPLPVACTARAVWELLEGGATGVVHVAGAERLSRWEIGCLLAARRGGRPAPVEPASIEEHPGLARSPDTTLDCTRARRWLTFELPGYREWLGRTG